MKAIAVISTAFLFLNNVFSQPGSLDKTFGHDGIATDSAAYGVPAVTALQADGKIVAASTYYPGSHPDFAVIRFKSNGELDSSFGENGRTITDFGNRDYVYAIALQPDGKIIVGGTTEDDKSHYKIAMARYKANGTLDSSFGKNGKVTTDRSNFGILHSIAIQPDGKILVADAGFGIAFFVIRYNINGKVDSSFGINGIARADFLNPDYYPYSYCEAIALQPDGKIVAAGTVYFEDNVLSHVNFALARFNQDGTLDKSFNGYGEAMYNFEGGCNAVVIQPDGRIVMAGYNDSDYNNFVLIRYNSNGKADSSFGTDGRVSTVFNGYDMAYAVAAQTNGKIVAAGFTDGYYGPFFSFDLARYNQDGQLDKSFGENGKVIIKYSDPYDGGNGGSVSIQSDGKIVQSGQSDSGITILRYNGDNVLAVNITNLKAVQLGQAVKISWDAVNEINTVEYDVEHSKDGSYFNQLGDIKAFNNNQTESTYSLLDEAPFKGNNFYRLKLVDKDGTISYTNIVHVNIAFNNTGITLFPNPVKDLLQIQGLSSSSKTITVINAKGKIIQQAFTSGNNYSIDTKQLTAGIYFIKIDEGDEPVTLKFIKE